MTQSTWTVADAQKLAFDAPVTDVRVRVVNGAVNVVGTDEEGPARLEVGRLEGPPLIVTHEDGVLTIAYEDLTWKAFLKSPRLDRKAWQRTAEVTLTVPAGARVELGAVGATAVVSGVRGGTEVRGVSGDSTLVGLAGPVRADTVSGNVEAQSVSGELRFHSVSGDLTVVDGTGGTVRADSVSGDMVLDLGPDPAGGPSEITLTSVSGEVAIRLPHPADTRVEANTASGSVRTAFEDLRVTGQWGAKRMTGTLGSGNGTLKASTVSGSIALLRRPAAAADPFEAAGTAEPDAPAAPPSLDKKVL
ncbi:DUF4097 family beta strand repeat-containing protein [Streptomyces sp. NPDC089919]|uniref:DUF4097 family beta strand repeat-containing protein n=1 Tax=Streptomyces sp. NPDC089919 TaxID=3155188 RepID=UPI00343B9D1F